MPKDALLFIFVKAIVQNILKKSISCININEQSNTPKQSAAETNEGITTLSQYRD